MHFLSQIVFGCRSFQYLLSLSLQLNILLIKNEFSRTNSVAAAFEHSGSELCSANVPNETKPGIQWESDFGYGWQFGHWC